MSFLHGLSIAAIALWFREDLCIFGSCKHIFFDSLTTFTFLLPQCVFVSILVKDQSSPICSQFIHAMHISSLEHIVSFECIKEKFSILSSTIFLWCSAGYQLQFSENHQQYCQWCQTCLHNHPGLMALLAHKHIICHLDEHEQQLHLIELSEGDLVVQMGSHP